jgi:hypothetical protein
VSDVDRNCVITLPGCPLSIFALYLQESSRCEVTTVLRIIVAVKLTFALGQRHAAMLFTRVITLLPTNCKPDVVRNK